MSTEVNRNEPVVSIKPKQTVSDQPVKNNNSDNNSVFATFNDNDNKVDMSDVLYKEGVEHSAEIDSFLQENSGKDWNDFLRFKMDSLIEFFNFKKSSELEYNNFEDSISNNFEMMTPQITPMPNHDRGPEDIVYNAMVTGKLPEGGEVTSFADGVKAYVVQGHYFVINDDGTPKLPITTFSEEEVKQHNQVKGTPKDEPVPDNSPVKNKPSDDNKLTKEEVNKIIDNLKPGESYSYLSTTTVDIPGFKSKKTTPVTVTRNQDGTLTMEQKVLADRRFISLKTVYSSDRSHMISNQEFNFDTHSVQTTFYGDDKKPEKIEIDVSNYQKIPSAFTKEGILLENMEKGYFNNSQLIDSEGNVILTYKDGNYYNAKGKLIDYDKAYKIIEKAKNPIQTLVHNY